MVLRLTDNTVFVPSLHNFFIQKSYLRINYSLAILLFSPLLGFLKSMLFVALLFTILSAWMFYLLIRDFELTKHPLWLTFLFLILPARWLIIHSVGSSETMFSFFIISSLYFLMKFEQTHKWRFIYRVTVSVGISPLG